MYNNTWHFLGLEYINEKDYGDDWTDDDDEIDDVDDIIDDWTDDDELNEILGH